MLVFALHFYRYFWLCFRYFLVAMAAVRYVPARSSSPVSTTSNTTTRFRPTSSTTLTTTARCPPTRWWSRVTCACVRLHGSFAVAQRLTITSTIFGWGSMTVHCNKEISNTMNNVLLSYWCRWGFSQNISMLSLIFVKTWADGVYLCSYSTRRKWILVHLMDFNII